MRPAGSGTEAEYAFKNKEKPESFVTVILSIQGYFDDREIRETQHLVEVSADVTLSEKQKARADYFLESRRYVLALQEYQKLLHDGEGLSPVFPGEGLP